jgi:hypothetical protein
MKASAHLSYSLQHKWLQDSENNTEMLAMASLNNDQFAVKA